MFRLRKPRIDDLIREYSQLKKETEAYRRAFENTSSEEVETRLKLVKELVRLFVKTTSVQIRVIKRFSPNVAKELKFKLGNYEKITLKSLSKDYQGILEIREMPKDMREKLVKNLKNDTINNSVTYMKLHGQLSDLILSACLDAMKRTRGKPPVELDEYISRLLLKHFPKYVKNYKGAWKALESDNPDKFTHCSASMRKIVKGILGKGARERKETLKSFSIFGSEAELIDSLAKTVESIHETFSKGVHSEIEHETALLSIRITEHILRYILEAKEKHS